MRAENQSHGAEAFLDGETFLEWRREVGTSALYLRENTGKLCRQIAEGPRWGEAALEALLYLAGAAQVQVRLTACEALASLLETPRTISTTARTAILWALEDALHDSDDWISRLAHLALRHHLMKEQAEASRLFPSLAAHDHEERVTAFRALHSLPVRLISQVYRDSADRLTDCLRLWKLPLLPLVLDRSACLVTYGRPGEAGTLKTFLNGLASASPENHAAIVVVTSDDSCQAVAAQHGAMLIPAEATSSHAAQDNLGLIFSIAHIVTAEKYLCVQPYISNYQFLWTVLDSLDALDENSLVVYPEGSGLSASPYYDPPEDETISLKGVQLTPNCVALDPALFAGHRKALLALDAAMRHLLPFVPEPIVEWRAVLFSLAANTNERVLPLNAKQITKSVPAQNTVLGLL